MKKLHLVVWQLVLSLLTFALAPTPSLAQNPCPSKGQRITKNAEKGAAIGAIVGLITNGKNGLWKGAVLGAGAGTAVGALSKSGCPAAQQTQPTQDRAPFPERVTPADQRQTSVDAEKMPTVYIRQMSMGNRDVLVGLLGPALYENKYALLDVYGHNQNADYVLDLAMVQLQQNYGNSNFSIQGRNGDIWAAPVSGGARFLVTIKAWHNGRFAPELSVVNLPVVVTQSGGSFQVYTRSGSTSIQAGRSEYGYTTDPYTVAAYKALVEAFGLR